MNKATPKGMPRPIGDDGKGGGPKPIPWTTGDAGRFGVSVGLEYECEEKSWCLVCGKKVYSGKVFALTPAAEGNYRSTPVKELYTQKDIGDTVLDQGPMHNKCALLTRAHCKEVRRLIADGEVEEVRYRL